MIPTPPRVLLARDPIDLRKGIAGLAAICEVHLGEAPLDGTLFVFSSRDRRGVKMLVWTHGGFLMLYKRLERGTFEVPSIGPDGAVKRELTPSELGLILEGVALDARPRRARLGRSAS